MVLDAQLTEQLLEARKRIVAQLEEIEFRGKATGFARRGGPPDYRTVYAQLQHELREINELLEPATKE